MGTKSPKIVRPRIAGREYCTVTELKPTLCVKVCSGEAAGVWICAKAPKEQATVNNKENINFFML
jgi:hypothetical protein